MSDTPYNTGSGFLQWISELNSSYINLYSPLIRIFKLDKDETKLDELYGDEKAAGRIYLSPFEMRAYHLNNTWRQMLGEGTMPYLETQENLSFVVNFDDMVRRIRDLKYGHITDLNIEYTGSENAYMVNLNNVLIIKDGSSQYTFNLESKAFNTTDKLAVSIHSLKNFKVDYYGKIMSSSKLVSFHKTYFYKNIKVNAYIPDETYKNVTDVIEAGDLILTHNWFLYEVLSNLPGGDFGWDYSTFVLGCNIRSVDKAQLPGNYIEQIKKHEYGLRNRINME